MEFPLNPDFPYYLAEADFVELGGQFDTAGGIDWSRLVFFAEEFSVRAGDHLIRQFDADNHVYVLTSGSLDVRVAISPGGPEQVVARVQPIAILGEQSFLDNGPRTASVVVREPGTVYRLSQQALTQMRRDEPELAWAFLTDIARSLSQRTRILQEKQFGP